MPTDSTLAMILRDILVLTSVYLFFHGKLPD